MEIVGGIQRDIDKIAGLYKIMGWSSKNHYRMILVCIAF